MEPNTPEMVAPFLLPQVYVTANSVVEREALPYVYIHEVVGDSLLAAEQQICTRTCSYC